MTIELPHQVYVNVQDGIYGHKSSLTFFSSMLYLINVFLRIDCFFVAVSICSLPTLWWTCGGGGHKRHRALLADRAIWTRLEHQLHHQALHHAVQYSCSAGIIIILTHGLLLSYYYSTKMNFAARSVKIYDAWCQPLTEEEAYFVALQDT
jgi:hypothetical protein